MAISSRKNSEELIEALVYAVNKLQANVTTPGFHRDLTQITSSPLFNQSGIVVTNVTVSAAAATDLPTTVALANNVLGVLNTHMLDDQAHLIKDTVNCPSLDGYTFAVDLPTVEVLLNAVKALFNAHLTQTGVHVTNDTTNAVVAANATNLGTAETLANALKTSVNAHIGNASSTFNSPRINIVAD